MSEQKRTIGEEIDISIENKMQSIPYPAFATIIKVYDNGYVDIITENETVFSYVQTVGIPILENKGVIIFLNGDITNRVFITGLNLEQYNNL